MKRILLYYPSVDLPQQDVLNRMLLYSDGIKTLFPLANLDKNKLNSDYQYLIDEGEFEPILVYELLKNYPDTAKKIDEEFISHAANIVSDKLNTSKNKDKTGLTLGNFFRVEKSYEPLKIKELFPEIFSYLKQNDFYGYESGTKYQIDTSDFADELRRQAIMSILIDSYAHNISAHSLTALNWWFKQRVDYVNKSKNEINSVSAKEEDVRKFSKLEINVGLLYVILIVDNIRNLFDDMLIPTSDKIEIHQFLSKHIVTDRATLNYDINKLLPNPLPNVDLKKIIKFKKQRRYELLNFRTVINEFEKKVGQASNIDEIKEVSLHFCETIEKESLGIEKMLKDAKIRFSSDNLNGILNLSNPNIQQALITGGLTGTMLNNPLSGFIAGAISLGLNSVVKTREMKKEIRDSPYSYIFYAKKKKFLK